MSSTIAVPQSTAELAPLMGKPGVLVVSCNQELRGLLLSRLDSDRWMLSQAGSGAEALDKIHRGEASLVLLDPALPDLRVEEFKVIVQAEYPEVTIIPLNPHTGQPIVGSPSPGSVSFEIVRKIECSLPTAPGIAISHSAVPEQEFDSGLPGFLGRSPSVQRLCSMVRLVSQRDTTVLITGESGTGKDVVARALHQLGTRRTKPFVVINCAAIPEALLEAELFGFVKGAFTGAVQSRIGRIHAAHGGTLFLDEIGDLPLGLQSKLLRFLEQGELQRLGSSDSFRVDVRVIAATNANLRRLVQERGFREDLFYRLSVFPIELSPLRERMEDLHLLAESFLAKFCPHRVAFSPQSLEILRQHTWPGNVRELRNVIERASILVGQGREIRPEHIII
ncbi:MAG TPA: sigma-54 dependent transcriptional regulator [Terriglobales bacterium]|nr:sigma-54 dependent transcriptional regulator [Terriglobales bacterium]